MLSYDPEVVTYILLISRLHMSPCTSLTHNVSLSLCYAVFPFPFASTHLPKFLCYRQDPTINLATLLQELSHISSYPPSPNRLHSIVRISLLDYSPAGEKTTMPPYKNNVLSLAQISYHIRLLCLPICPSFFLYHIRLLRLLLSPSFLLVPRIFGV